MYLPNPQTPCDDGLYCTGTDTCGDDDILCSVHSGNPCSIGTICNEDTDSCDVLPLSSITTTANQGTTTSTSEFKNGVMVVVEDPGVSSPCILSPIKPISLIVTAFGCLI